jgi:DNA alkylation repair enzyme
LHGPISGRPREERISNGKLESGPGEQKEMTCGRTTGSARAVEPRLQGLIRELRSVADPNRAASAVWFFKTAKGQYGEGDRFLGIPVPVLRRTALRYGDLAFPDIDCLVRSPIHEHRSAGFEILVAQYERGDALRREKVFRFYLRHTHCANNWDLVDTSAPYIVGEHLTTRRRDLLDRLARSKLVWERRIAIVSTFAFLRRGETKDTFRIVERLLGDRHDLIHKALGWALRESGKVSLHRLRSFLERHYARIPRTTLRYAIERFPLAQRRRLLAGKF